MLRKNTLWVQGIPLSHCGGGAVEEWVGKDTGSHRAAGHVLRQGNLWRESKVWGVSVVAPHRVSEEIERLRVVPVPHKQLVRSFSLVKHARFGGRTRKFGFPVFFCSFCEWLRCGEEYAS